jgi:hypothetical protein
VRTAGNQRVVVRVVRLHSTFTPAIMQLHALPSQSSTTVTRCILMATNLLTHAGWTAWLTVFAPGPMQVHQTRVQ